MTNWKYKLDFKDLWDYYDRSEDEKDESELIKEIGAKIKARIEAAPFYNTFKDELEEIASNFEDLDSKTNFNYAMQDLYDWADFNLCWVATLF